MRFLIFEQLLFILLVLGCTAFIILLIASILGLILRKSWGKKTLRWSFLPLSVTFVCIVIVVIIVADKSPVAEENIENSQSEIVIDFDEFTHEIANFIYNKDDNSIDIDISTNIPNGTKVEIGFNKMIVSSEGINGLDDPIVNNLSWEREVMEVSDGKISLHYVGLDKGIPFVNGEYGVWLSFEVGPLINRELYDVLGSVEDAKSKFKANTFSGSEEYAIILAQQFFDITDSISYNELKKQKHEQIEQKKVNAKDIRFAELEKNPDKHNGEFVKYQGEVLQIMEDETSTVIRLAVTKESYGYSSSDVVYVTYTGTTSFVKEDIVTVYGAVKGSHTYESQAGHQITLPRVEAEIIE